MASVGEHYIRTEDDRRFTVIRVRSGAVWLSAGEDFEGVIVPEDQLGGPDWAVE